MTLFTVSCSAAAYVYGEVYQEPARACLILCSCACRAPALIFSLLNQGYDLFELDRIVFLLCSTAIFLFLRLCQRSVPWPN